MNLGAAIGIAKRPARRAGLVAAISYLGLPLAYDALARARVDGFVAFAATPSA